VEEHRTGGGEQRLKGNHPLSNGILLKLGRRIAPKPRRNQALRRLGKTKAADHCELRPRTRKQFCARDLTDDELTPLAQLFNFALLHQPVGKGGIQLHKRDEFVRLLKPLRSA
jgi:hypothetical protein